MQDVVLLGPPPPPPSSEHCSSCIICVCENGASFLCVHHKVTVTPKIYSAKTTFLYPSLILFDRDAWADYGSNKMIHVQVIW
jgi:hypothetical protein